MCAPPAAAQIKQAANSGMQQPCQSAEPVFNVMPWASHSHYSLFFFLYYFSSLFSIVIHSKLYTPHPQNTSSAIQKRRAEKFNSQMQQLFAYIFVHFIAPQQGRQHSLFCWQPVITPILLHRLYHITPFSTIYLYFALFIYPSCRNAQFPQALPKYDLA